MARWERLCLPQIWPEPCGAGQINKNMCFTYIWSINNTGAPKMIGAPPFHKLICLDGRERRHFRRLDMFGESRQDGVKIVKALIKCR